jgi:monoamine oxidase
LSDVGLSLGSWGCRVGCPYWSVRNANGHSISSELQIFHVVLLLHALFSFLVHETAAVIILLVITQTKRLQTIMNIAGPAVDALVVGAGLSGAYAANRLMAANRSVTVVDGRNRIGGRLLTADPQGGGDLGGAWIWPRQEYIMKNALQEFNVKTVPMWLEGHVFARLHNGQQQVIPDFAGNYAACGTGAVRVSGGASNMVQTLLQDSKISVELGKRITRIEYDESGAHVHYRKTDSNRDDDSTETIHCRTVILAAPPKVLANTIEFVPPLPKEKLESMRATPTWMEDYGKVAVSFPENWWRQQKMSAISIDQMGEVQTWWEACSGEDEDGTRPTLAGFVTAKGANELKKIAGKGPDALHDHILTALMKIYGVDAKSIGLDDSTCGEVTQSGTPGEDGLVVSKGGVTITYKR